MAADHEPGFPSLKKVWGRLPSNLAHSAASPTLQPSMTNRLQGISRDSLAAARKRAQTGGRPLGSVKQTVEALLASVHSTAGLGTWLGPPRPESRLLVTLRVVEGLAL